MSDRERWLNGWPRSRQGAVYMGSMGYCVGCGTEHGLITVALTGDEDWPTDPPDWPFDRDTCPLCWHRENWPSSAADKPRGPRRLP